MIIESKYFSKNRVKELYNWRKEKSFPLVYPYMFFFKDDNYYMYEPNDNTKEVFSIYKITGYNSYDWIYSGDTYIDMVKISHTVLNYNYNEPIPSDVLDGMSTIYDSVLIESFWIYNRNDKTIKRSNNCEIPVMNGVLALPGDYSLDEIQNYFLSTPAIVDLKQMNTDGRKICAQCQGPIKVLPGFDVSYNHCPICEP